MLRTALELQRPTIPIRRPSRRRTAGAADTRWVQGRASSQVDSKGLRKFRAACRRNLKSKSFQRISEMAINGYKCAWWRAAALAACREQLALQLGSKQAVAGIRRWVASAAVGLEIRRRGQANDIAQRPSCSGRQPWHLAERQHKCQTGLQLAESRPCRWDGRAAADLESSRSTGPVLGQATQAGGGRTRRSILCM